MRPAGTCACETGTLKEPTINGLMVFERKVLRKIFSSTNENGIWRIKTNQELDKIITHRNIINFIRAQRLGWLGHIERMQESRRPIGRPKIRWEDNVRKDIQKLKVPNWKTLVQDRRWKELVEKAKTLHKELYSHNKKKCFCEHDDERSVSIINPETYLQVR
jgi:hypothetical protein